MTPASGPSRGARASPASAAADRAERRASRENFGATALLAARDAMAKLSHLGHRLRTRRAHIVEDWADRYEQCFGGGGYFERREFIAFFGGELEAILAALEAGSALELEAELAVRGVELNAMGVPFAELVSSIHLFEESCLQQLGPAASLADHRTLDRLSHVRIALLASAYVEARDEDHLALESALEHDLAKLARDTLGRERLEALVGRSEPMQILYRRLDVAAESHAPVLLVGESGTGKELAARAIHLRSPRKRGPFVPVNCAALTSTLLESELFGHRRGAFTGADSDALGLVRHADGGTLFLDEVTEMPPEAQAKLLREVPSDSFRVVASTNCDIDDAVRRGKLREDLLYRLRTFVIELPPLRERLDDLPLLARTLLERAGLAHVTLSPAALARLKQHPFAGNVRELDSTLQAAAAAAPHGRIRVVDLPRPASHARAASARRGDTAAESPLPTLHQAELDLVQRALAEAGGNKRRAAALLGVSRKWLYARLAELGRDIATPDP